MKKKFVRGAECTDWSKRNRKGKEGCHGSGLKSKKGKKRVGGQRVVAVVTKEGKVGARKGG